MVAYPNELPLDAVGVLLGYVKGKAPATSDAFKAAWNVVGYGLGKGLPTQEAYGDFVDPNEEAALELLLSDIDAPQGILISVAIGVAIKVAMRILKELIA
jgi:hypothetical protein